PPQFSQSAAQAVEEREKQLGIVFPGSVREWYSLEDAVGVLGGYSNDDWSVEISKLGEPVDNWYNRGPRDFLSENLLVFLHENQGVCNWAVSLTGDADPPVMVEESTVPGAQWLPCSDSFSTFVWCQVWDHSGPRSFSAVGVFAQEEQLSPKDLHFLRSNFRQL